MERDRLEFTTPEGVTLDLELAGIGSRALAGALDLVIQGFMLFLAVFVLGFGGIQVAGAGTDTSLLILVVVFVLGSLAILVGYHVVFEVWGRGRTPGKRVFGVRVVRMDGGPVRLSQSLIRTFLRLIDYLPGMYGIGVIAVFASGKNQRLGDMAAGTVVIVDRSRRSNPTATAAPVGSQPYSPWDAGESPAVAVGDRANPTGWDVSRVTDRELALVRRFLDRRWSIENPARAAIADDLAGRLRPRVVSPAAPMANEDFLARVVELKRGTA
jgi:uncharacterized RDD family membrane protein YckC